MKNVTNNRKYIHTSLLQILTLIGICSLVGLGSHLYWFFDIFNHFRPQAIFVSLIILLFSLLFKDTKSIVLASIIILLNVSLIFVRLNNFPLAQEGQGHKESSITVMSANLLSTNEDRQKIQHILSSHQPDIFIATEVTKRWDNEFKHAKNTYPYSATIPRSDNFGMAIYSKLPFTPQKKNIGQNQLPLLIATFTQFTLIAAHPLPPLNDRMAQELTDYMKEVATIVRQTKGPLILAGDLNATLWSETLKELEDLDLKRTSLVGTSWTWPSFFFPLAIQIDHIFVKDLNASVIQKLPNIGSDHFPIITTIKHSF